MIACAGVVKRFPDRVALDGLSLEIEPGAIAVLLGSNGAGKTTLLRMLAGRLTPDEGTVRIAGTDPARDRAAVAARVGVAASAPSAWSLRLDAHANLVLFGVAQGLDRRTARAAADREIERAALTEHVGRPVGGFSQGMRARLAVARALLADPEVLLLDEPSAGLDAASTQRLRSQLASEHPARTIVLSTHDVAEFAPIATVAFLLRSGRVTQTARGPLSADAPFGGGPG